MDMSEKLWQVYNRLDPVSLDNLLTEVTLSFFFSSASSCPEIHCGYKE